MTTTDSGLAEVDRYWRQVTDQPWREHFYVSLLGLRTYDPVELHTRLEDGLSYEALERLRRILDVPASRVAALIRIPPRTLIRRKEAKRLHPEESDRLLRLSRLVGLTLRLFEGSLPATRAWLKTPHVALGHQPPMDFATTEVGAREVEYLIGRLEQGIPL